MAFYDLEHNVVADPGWAVRDNAAAAWGIGGGVVYDIGHRGSQGNNMSLDPYSR